VEQCFTVCYNEHMQTLNQLDLGSYHSPSGAVVKLRSPADVHALFRALLRRMPGVSIVTDTRHPRRTALYVGRAR